MTYEGRKKQLKMHYGKDTLIGMIMEKENGDEKREKYLNRLTKKQLVQVLLSIEYGNTKGYQPLKSKKSKKGKVRDVSDSSSDEHL